MPALPHANTAATVAIALVIVVAVAVVLLAIVVAVFVVVDEVLLVALFFPRAYGRGLGDKTAQRSAEYLMGQRDSKAC